MGYKSKLTKDDDTIISTSYFIHGESLDYNIFSVLWVQKTLSHCMYKSYYDYLYNVLLLCKNVYIIIIISIIMLLLCLIKCLLNIFCNFVFGGHTY